MNHKRFSYHKPQSWEEFDELEKRLKNHRKTYFFYSGGTELMTQFRRGVQVADALVDIKGLPDICNVFRTEKKIKVGSCVNLNQMANESIGDMAIVFKKIADHTIRNALTLGGNICGRLPFREAVLPLLARQATVGLYKDGKYDKQNLDKVFQGLMRMEKGTLVCDFEWHHAQPAYEKSQRFDSGVSVDYPLVHHYTFLEGDRLFIGVSGFSALPMAAHFSLKALGKIKGTQEQCAFLLNPFYEKAKSDSLASSSYRQGLLREATKIVLKEMEA